MSIRTSRKALRTELLSSIVMSLSIGLLMSNAAHAEQYCKSVDKDGNATYTLAPDKGCSAKKLKTVAINHHITPNSPTAPKLAETKADSTTEATSATAPADTATTSTTPSTSVATPPTSNPPK